MNAQYVYYGDVINLQNQWNNGKGGYLNAKGYDKTGNLLGVSTSTSANRDNGSGTLIVEIN